MDEIVDKCLKRGKYEQSVKAVDKWLEDYIYDNPEYQDVIDSQDNMNFDPEEEEWLRGEIVDDRFAEVGLL